ncbi:Endolytic murein transglycosylase [Neomoorella glycerini]|uniref:Endolytic murein transglycosylase n=1 Tax=Neomoorella glycerini TaxID=55779 RepID=A0A6I5ZLQ2_9FIRM|nr:endolytic transglycosylase MltG [Moorella glycerini]QGP90736.1 Endolytic murein transglycosylase [Moorella glycerini]
MGEELEPSYNLACGRPWHRRLILFLAIIILTVGGSGYFFLTLLAPAKPGAPAVEVTIAPGSSSAVIASSLTSQGIIKSPLAFRLVTMVTGLDRQLKPGHYLISPGLSLREIIGLLAAGKVHEIEFTIPEGYTVRQIAALLQQKGVIQEEDFLRAAARDYPFDFLQGLPSGPEHVQGFLFPDTYRVARGTPAEEIILMMLKRFNQVYQEISREKDPGLELNTRQIVTLASIVEREAKLDAERPLIAGVFVNRLKKGMRLESCATVEYLLPAPKPVLSYQDLQIDSPYNTYRVNGLPPGPIASPGRASLLAALKPAATDYLYFVAKPDGTHYFSRTLAEHNRALARYQAGNGN